MRGLSRKLYLDLSVPTEEDQRSDQQRILEAFIRGGREEEVHIPVRMLRQLYPLLDRARLENNRFAFLEWRKMGAG